MKNLKIIGLTGTYCAGKNYVSSLIEAHGIPALDLDKLGHQVIEAEKERITRIFGEDILSPAGAVDRKRLGEKVFGRPEKLAALEEIVHPAVNRETLSWINARNEKACVINAALLHRSSAFKMMDAIIIVEAPFIERLFRAKMRDHLSWPALIRRFKSQKDFHSQYFKGKTDIYRVSNPSVCSNSVFFGLFLRQRPENRIREILSLLGLI